MAKPNSNSLCLECGLCCNGVIFADVQLQSGDNAARLRALGLAFAKTPKFHQPCTAFAGCKCNIYSERPSYCREFECLLLKHVKAGEIEPRRALRTIRSTLKQVENVKRLLRQLGDNEENLALSKRFRRMRRKLESGPLNKKTAHTFSELTLAMHDLNVLLSEKFYPSS
jgi:Fe-S-cluster containining protein